MWSFFLLVVLWGGAGFAEVESALPFAVEGHPSAKSSVAREMLRRLKEDVRYFANEVSAVASYWPFFVHLMPLISRRCSVRGVQRLGCVGCQHRSVSCNFEFGMRGSAECLDKEMRQPCSVKP